MSVRLTRYLLPAALALMAATPVYADDTSQTRKVTLAGRSFDYGVAGYHICITFNDEDSLRWIYLDAPGDEVGKTSSEQFDRRDIRPDVIMLAWTEDTGSNITDVFDFTEMAVHASFITAGGDRYMSDADITERDDCDQP